MDSIAAAFLRADPVSHADMLAVLADADVRYAAPDGVVLHFDDIHYISAVSDAVALKLLPLAAQDACIVSHHDALVAPLCAQFGYRFLMRSRNHVYLHDAPPRYTLPPNAAFRALTRDDLPTVLAHYHTSSDADYVAERLDAGMRGATVDGKLAGFIGTHTERSIGFLAVLPEYRRMGLAFALEASVIQDELAQGRVPFAQVVVDNAPSNALQKKLGMVSGDHPIIWLGRNA